MADPLIFDEYFESEEEIFSPFLTPQTRKWGDQLQLKAAILGAVLLFISFILLMNGLKPLAMALLVPVYFIAGSLALIESLEDIMSLHLNIDILMTLAAFGSVVIGSPMEGALLLVLFSISGAMEEAVTSKAKGSLRELNKLSPTTAWVIEGPGKYVQRSVKDVKIGDLILIKANEVVPLDGKVASGTTSLNLVHLTGENLPVTKTLGDEVPSGGKNLEGSIEVIVTHTSADSTLSRIIKLVTEAQGAKPRLQQWFDNLSRRYASTIIFLAFFFSLVFPFLFNMPFLGEEGSIYRALAFLIAASPCALIIAIPIAYLSALSASAKKGILLKGGITLDAIAQCEAMAFDKTGTLTTGHLSLIGAESLSGEEIPLKALEIAYALETKAVHPIGKAIQEYGEKKDLIPYPLTNFISIPGYGLKAEADEKQVFIGVPSYVIDRLEGEQKQELIKKIDRFREKGELLAVMHFENELYIFRFIDDARPLAKNALSSLKSKGISLYMLTGDHQESAKKIAEEMGIGNYYYDLKPADKLRIVSELSETMPVAFAGDGVNDAPALARAAVGISMGKGGSKAAIDAADVVLLHDDIERIDWLFEKAKKTKKIVRQNLTIAALAILVAAIPALLGFVPLWLAVVMHEGGTILVGLNGLRLLRT